MADKCPKCGADFIRTKPNGEKVYKCMSYSLKRRFCETDVFFENLQCLRRQLAQAQAKNKRLRDALCGHCRSGYPVVNGVHIIRRLSECEPNEHYDEQSEVEDRIVCPAARAALAKEEPQSKDAHGKDSDEHNRPSD